jgi:type IV pilus assembly protein PilB
MPISQVIADLILREASTSNIASQSQQEGVLNLRQSGLLKVIQGVTSLEEVFGATIE